MADAPTLTKELRNALLRISRHPTINLPPKTHIDVLIGRGYVEQRLGASVVTNKGFALLRGGARRY